MRTALALPLFIRRRRGFQARWHRADPDEETSARGAWNLWDSYLTGRNLKRDKKGARQQVEIDHTAGVRRAEGNEAVQQDELFVLDYQGERTELEGANKTIQGDALQSVL